MLSVADRTVQLVEQKIDAEIKRIMEIVEAASISVIPDYATFRYLIGQVHGLRVAKADLITEAKAEAAQEATGR